MPRGKAKKLSEVDTEIDVNAPDQAAEAELSEFIEGIGPQGMSEVSLYRILNTGKWRFLVSGPPSQFSEQYVQQTFGGGDFLVRGKLNGKWFRSKSFSVEGLANGNGNHSGGDDLERLKLRIQESETRMESERQLREQRMHEIQLAMIERGNNGGAPPMNIGDMIQAVKALNDMGGQDKIDKAIERIFSLAGKVQQLTNPQPAGDGTGGWWDWAKPIAAEAGKAILPRVLPFLQNAGPPMAPAATVAGAPTLPEMPQAIPPNVGALGGDAAPAAAPTMTDAERIEIEFRAQKHEALLFALSMARLNRSPEVWADLALEQIETSNNPITTRFVQEIMKSESFEKWFEDLEKLEASVITQRPWFEVFYQSVKETLNAKDEPIDRGT